jgi:hypothetical protein
MNKPEQVETNAERERPSEEVGTQAILEIELEKLAQVAGGPDGGGVGVAE